MSWKIARDKRNGENPDDLFVGGNNTICALISISPTLLYLVRAWVDRRVDEINLQKFSYDAKFNKHRRRLPRNSPQ